MDRILEIIRWNFLNWFEKFKDMNLKINWNFILQMLKTIELICEISNILKKLHSIEGMTIFQENVIESACTLDIISKQSVEALANSVVVIIINFQKSYTFSGKRFQSNSYTHELSLIEIKTDTVQKCCRPLHIRSIWLLFIWLNFGVCSQS